MSYAEETSPDSIIPVCSWTRQQFAEFEYSLADRALSTLVENPIEIDEKFEDAVNRLAQISAVTGDVRARVSLGVFGGLDRQDGARFRHLVDNPVDENFDYSTHLTLLRAARAHRNSGDYLRYLALSATVGIYPPEYGDTIVDPADIELNPNFDIENDMRTGVQTHLIGAPGNGG
jgi:hypothetical protein